MNRKHTALIIFIFVATGSGALFWNIRSSTTGETGLRSIATVSSNIHYCNSDNAAQTLDLYRPKNTENATLPLLIYIHGGGWRHGDKNGPLLRTYAPGFLNRKIAVASFNYRLQSPSPYPDQNNDVACALTYINSNAERLGIDTEKMIYFGDSAGGQLAAFAALNIPYKHYDYEAPIGVIDFYGVSDFARIVNGSRPDINARRYLGSRYNKTATAASPTTYVTKKAPQFLLVHGANDKVVPVSQSEVFFNQLIQNGIDAKYVIIPGAGHAFIGPELSSADYKIIQDNIAEFINETMNR